MEVTGGQPELMDMLPALTIGPGHFLFLIILQLGVETLGKTISLVPSQSDQDHDHVNLNLSARVPATLGFN